MSSESIKRSYRVVMVDGEIEKHYMLGLGLFQYEHQEDTYSLIFRRPNLISMYLHITESSFERALDILKSDLEPTLKENEKSKQLTFEADRNTEKVHDFIEELLKTVAFSYSALEAFANRWIYQADRMSVEVRKEYIRNHSLSEKLMKDIPRIFGIKRVHTQRKYMKVWGEFRDLERLRHDMIHSKGGQRSDQEFVSSLYYEVVVRRVQVSVEALMKAFIVALPDNIEMPAHLASGGYRVTRVEDIKPMIDRGEI